MEEEIFIERQIACLSELIKMHKLIKDIHVSLGKLYPITVIDNGYFYVFDKNEFGTNYEFKFKTIMQTPVYGNFLAAAPLEFYDMKLSVVVSGNIFRNSYNNVRIFHEFVHCFQMEKGELFIKKELLIDKAAKANNNNSWETDFSFPFKNEYFIDKTAELSKALFKKDYEYIVNYHDNIKSYLNDIEFEYMIWQEWKEGFARYIENLIRKRLELSLNRNIMNPPFGRVHLYEIGNVYVELLIKRNSEFSDNILKLFDRMISYSYNFK